MKKKDTVTVVNNTDWSSNCVHVSIKIWDHVSLRYETVGAKHIWWWSCPQ